MAQTYLYSYGSGPWGASPNRRTRGYIETQWGWSKLHPEMMRRLFALADEVIARGSDFGFGGGARSTQTQYNLFKSRYTKVSSAPYSVYWNGSPSWPSEAGYYRKNAGVASAAPPGRSYHEPTTVNGTGYALAADMVGDHKLANAICHQFGLRHFANVNSEPWHYQPIEIPTSRSKYIKQAEPLPMFALPGTPPPTPPPIPPEIDMSNYVPHNPVRILDTRKTGKLAAGEARVVSPHGYTNDNASSVVLNLTGVQAAAVGYVTLWDGKATRPEASQLNVGPGDPSPKNGFTITPLNSKEFKVFSSVSTHLIIDQVGFFEQPTTALRA